MGVRLFNNRLELLRVVPKEAICAEVGVYAGLFSKEILARTSPKKLHLIDCWSTSPDTTPFVQQITPGMWEALYLDLLEEFKEDERVEIHRGWSHEVLSSFPDDYFDWVYIDANHAYEYVLKDIQISCRKVKDGGLILGHDFDFSTVQRAVFEVVNSRQCAIDCFSDEDRFHSFGLRVTRSLRFL